MGPSPRPQQKLDFSTLPSLVPNQSSSRPDSATSSPIEAPQERQSRFAGAFGSMGTPSSARLGSSSPSHELGGRPYSTRRTRELQQSEGLGWGPPVASGLSTPLRETIPESPGDDTFPDFNAPSSQDTRPLSRRPSTREQRNRAGTTPSRFPGLSEAPTSGGQQLRTTLSSRVTPSGSPHRRPSTASITDSDISRTLPGGTSNPLLARIRSDSQPTRAYPAFSPFGSSIWSTNPRPRSSTLGSHQSDEARDAPPSDPMYDTDQKTLEMLGLDSTSVFARNGDSTRLTASRKPMASEVNRVLSNRFRSYSTNYKDQYAREEEAAAGQSPFGSGTITPSSQAANILAQNNAHLLAYNAKLQAQIEQHGMNGAGSSRPRARTTGIIDPSPSRFWRSDSVTSNTAQRPEQPPSRFDWSMDDPTDYTGLTNAVHAMHLQTGMAAPDTSTRDGQSRAIWLGGVPHHTTEELLKQMFEPFGKVESARAMTQKGYAFVNFESVNSAIMAKLQYDGHEIFPGQGPTRIAFAKEPSNTGTPGAQDGMTVSGASMNGQQLPSQYQTSSNMGASAHGRALGSADANLTTAPSLPQPIHMRDDIVAICKEFGAGKDDLTKISDMVGQAGRFTDYALDIPSVPEPSQIRIHDAPRLRDIRKRIDNGAYTQAEVEEIAQAMLPEVVELSSDYLGNTVVQKLFECCTDPTKEAMLAQIAPFLAQIGAHKNGTWAAQTIIRVASTRAQQDMIVDGLRPYAMASFLDQYGNYVMQGCLKFGPPSSDFLFQCMLSQLWTLGQARFGVRAMRACLESQDASKNQQRMLAATVALCSSQLATNSNGALLLTWYLDTCNFRNRRKILAPRLIPHLTQLCTHKVAYMTVLKLVNQKEEPDAREQILRALFFSENDEVLEAVLKDQVCGATFVFKTLTTPFIDEHLRPDAVENVRNILAKIKAPPNQAYKRLMDEVSLTRTTAPSEGRANGMSPKKPRQNQHQANGNAFHAQQSYLPQQPNGSYDAYSANGSNYGANSLPSPMTPHQAQPYPHPQQYAQNRYNYNPMMNSNGYPTPMSAYGASGRANQSHLNPAASPMMPQMGYGPMLGMNHGGQWPQQQYGMPPAYNMPPQQHQQQMHMHDMMNGGGNGNRRGRR